MTKRLIVLGQHGGLVVSTVASHQEGPGLDVCVEFACSPMSVWVLCGYSGFLTQSKDMQVNL